MEITAIVLAFLVICGPAVWLLVYLRRCERRAYGGPPPPHLLLTRWMLRRPWLAAGLVAVVFGLVSLLASREPLRALAVAAVMFAVLGSSYRYGPARWWGRRRLRHYR